MDPLVAGWRRYALVQLPIMLMMLATSMSGTVLTDLILYRTCTITLRINHTECQILHDNSSSAEALKINSLVQPHVTLILACKSFVESVFPSVLILFLGPWSDKYGRKPIILLGYIGVSLNYFLLTVMASHDISPWYLLIAYIPIAFVGGLFILISGSICYIIDITNEEERGWHMAWLDALISLGLLIGLFCGPEIFERFGYTAVFGSATVFCVVATLYIWICVPETIQSDTSRSIYQIFDCALVKELIHACIKRRDGFKRLLIWNCIACLMLLLIPLQGELTIGYLFTNIRLGWTVEKYSDYIGISIAVGILGTISGIKLLKTFTGLPEAIIAIISVTSSLSNSVTSGLVWRSWHMYLATGIGCFSSASRPMIRSILSKAISAEDIGKVFSLTTSLETLLPFAATSLYSFIYSSYMPPMYPEPVWFLSVAFYVVVIILLISIQIIMKYNNRSSYVSLIENND